MSSTFLPMNSESETIRPSLSGRVKSGAFVFSAIMVASSFNDSCCFEAFRHLLRLKAFDSFRMVLKVMFVMECKGD